MIPTKEDLEWLDADLSYIADLTDMELIELMGENQYNDGYKFGLALADEYCKRFLQEEFL